MIPILLTKPPYAARSRDRMAHLINKVNRCFIIMVLGAQVTPGRQEESISNSWTIELLTTEARIPSVFAGPQSSEQPMTEYHQLRIE
jgi:hypothetical protein